MCKIMVDSKLGKEVSQNKKLIEATMSDKIEIKKTAFILNFDFFDVF